MRKRFKVYAHDLRYPATMIVVARSGESWRLGGQQFLEIGDQFYAEKLTDYSWDWKHFSAFEKLPTMPQGLVAKVWMDN